MSDSWIFIRALIGWMLRSLFFLRLPQVSGMDLLLSSNRGISFRNTAWIAGIHENYKFFDLMLSKSSLKSLFDIADEKRSSRTASYGIRYLKVYPSRCRGGLLLHRHGRKINNYDRFFISILKQPAADRVLILNLVASSSRSIWSYQVWFRLYSDRWTAGIFLSIGTCKSQFWYVRIFVLWNPDYQGISIFKWWTIDHIAASIYCIPDYHYL